MLPPEITAWVRDWIWWLLAGFALLALISKFGLGKIWRWAVLAGILFSVGLVVRWRSAASSSDWKEELAKAAQLGDWEKFGDVIEKKSGLPLGEVAHLRDLYERTKILDEKLSEFENPTGRKGDGGKSDAKPAPKIAAPPDARAEKRDAPKTAAPPDAQAEKREVESRERPVAEVPLDPAEHCAQALEFEKRGEAARALRELGLALEAEPATHLDHYAQGLAYMRGGDLDKALASFQQSLRMQPDFAEAYLQRGIVYEESGFFEKAMGDYFSAVAFHPRLFDTYIRRGGLYHKTGRWFEALMDYNMAIDLGGPEEILLRKIAILESSLRQE